MYYFYNDTTKRLAAAPRVITLASGARIANPTAADLAAIGAYPKAAETPPEAPEGKAAVIDGYELSNGLWTDLWRFDDIPPAPPRIFSKLKVVAALINAGVWADVKAYIEGAGLYDLYLAAQNFAEDNDYFVQGKAALQTALDWTDEQVESILAASVAD